MEVSEGFLQLDCLVAVRTDKTLELWSVHHYTVELVVLYTFKTSLKHNIHLVLPMTILKGHLNFQ